jgi:hypothetical protein
MVSLSLSSPLLMLSPESLVDAAEGGRDARRELVELASVAPWVEREMTETGEAGPETARTGTLVCFLDAPRARMSGRTGGPLDNASSKQQKQLR